MIIIASSDSKYYASLITLNRQRLTGIFQKSLGTSVNASTDIVRFASRVQILDAFCMV